MVFDSGPLELFRFACSWQSLAPLLVAVCVIAGCDGGGEPERNHPGDQAGVGTGGHPGRSSDIAFEQLDPAMPVSGRFSRLDSDHSGIGFVHHWQKPQQDYDFKTLPVYSGVTIGDYDGDGLADVYLTRQSAGSRLYRNLGDFRFEDITDSAGLSESFWGTGASFVDIDGDGDLDLYVCAFQEPNRLYMNQGDGTFVDEAVGHGLAFDGASIMMAFADYDNDGDLDGYLLTNRQQPTDHAALARQLNAAFHHDRDRNMAYYDEHVLELMDVITITENGKRYARPIMAGQYDHLYRNNGDGTWTDVSTEAGIEGNDIGLGATWWDYDNDGWADLYVANDFFGQDILYHNNGDGSFTDVAKSALPHTPWSSMGCDVADINNDGQLDFFSSDMSEIGHYRQKVTMGNMSSQAWFLEWGQPRQYMRNAMYLNTGTGRFMEAAQMLGIDKTNWSWAVKFADLDQDGRVDLFVTNGMVRDWENADVVAQGNALGGDLSVRGRAFWLSQAPNRRKNLAYRNGGDLRFESVGERWGLDHEGVSFGAAWGDLDNDGDLDLVVNNFEEPAGVYRNELSSGHRIKIRLVGVSSNRWGLGATVQLKNASGVQMRYLTLARGFMSADESLVHFGLGDEVQISELTVRWPSGHYQRFTDLEADRFYTITEPSEPAPGVLENSGSDRSLYVRSKYMDANKYRHKEQAYDDYADQPLLPNKLSQLGPALAWGDLDGDGDEDLFVGGASGQFGRPYMRLDDGRLVGRAWTWKTFEMDRDSEDMGILLFDADTDGDLDVYVVSGGVEHGERTELLRDRLYRNDGTGQFEKMPAGVLPDHEDSGSVVAAADFDRDGDLDLFVGSRVIPGAYPLTPASRLLRNDYSSEGRFTDVTEQLAPQLLRTGLVTSGLWSDADGDGDVDLLVTHEWGPVKLYVNESGHFEDRSESWGLLERLGWWNGIAGADVDHDGDMDYVVTNFGLNTKYHVSVQKPALLYYGDFEGDGQKKLVEAEYEQDVLYPIRGKSCSTHAIPSLSEKFKTFHDFAIADLSSLYTSRCLNEADRFEVNTLESGVLINESGVSFRFEAFPRVAQISPGFGVVATEVDGDGHPDVYLVQNFYGPQRETGRMDGGVSLLLRGIGDGRFEPIWPDKSGLVVAGDAKSLTATDLNDDGWVDFVIGVNNEALVAYEHRGSGVNRVLRVYLSGRAGNPAAVGARVTMRLEGGPTQSAEVYAGGGYLSQSSSALAFGLGAEAKMNQIQVRWPNGLTTVHRPGKGLRMIGQRQIVIEQPGQ